MLAAASFRAIPLPSLVLQPEGDLPEPFSKNDFAARVHALRDKFFEILRKESGMRAKDYTRGAG